MASDDLQTVRQPEGAREKHSFATRQPVDLFELRLITQHKTVFHQVALNCCDSAEDALVVRREKPYQRHHQQRGVQTVRSIKLGKRLAFRIEAARANFRMNFISNRFPTSEILAR